MKKPITPYELTREVKEEVNTRLKELLLTCQHYKIPMYATVAVANSEDGTEYKRVIYSPQANRLSLKDDEIRKNELVANGFEVSVPREVISIDLPDFPGMDELI